MALISCSECGSQVSSNAAACPKCGNGINIIPATGDNRSINFGKALISFGVAILALIAAISAALPLIALAWVWFSG